MATLPVVVAVAAASVVVAMLGAVAMARAFSAPASCGSTPPRLAAIDAATAEPVAADSSIAALMVAQVVVEVEFSIADR